MSTPLWTQKAPLPAAPGLATDTRAEICVIGAGIAGLSTAYLLAKEGRSVVVLEDGVPGGGQSMRTSAHLSCAIDDRIFEIEHIHGHRGARLAVQSHAAAIDLIESIDRQEHLESDFERIDGYLFAGTGVSPSYLDRELAAAHHAGLSHVQRLSHAPLATFDTGPCLRFPRQARFHPVRYLTGLAAAFQKRGGRLYGGAHVISVHGGKPATVTTRAGATVVAEAVVVATNTPVINRVVLHTKMHPYLSYVVAVPVAPGSVPDSLFWDMEEPYHYVRLHHEGREELLIVGGEDHWVGDARDFEARYRSLESWARERFAVLGPARARWSGEIQETIDGLAFIGRNPMDEDNVYVIAGDSGMGLTHGTLGGRILCDLIQGRQNEWAALYDPARKPVHTLSHYVVDNLVMAWQYRDYLRGGDVRSADKIAPGEGAILQRGVKKIAVYRDEEGVVHECSGVCPHLGGVVRWNANEKTWDCPVHGSRFSAMGKVLQGPCAEDLKKLGGEERRKAS